MPAANVEGVPFLLSKRSREKAHNLFVLRMTPTRIEFAGGWNLTVHRDMTAQTFYRWIDLATLGANYSWPEAPQYNFEVRPVAHNIQLLGFLTYLYSTRNGRGVPGAAVPRASTDIMRAGVYGIFHPGTENIWRENLNFDVPAKSLTSQMRMEDQCATAVSPTREVLPSAEYQAAYHPHVVANVVHRDGGKCFFTGGITNSATVEWIFPPPCGTHLEEEKYFIATDNAITISAELVRAFKANVLSVDCDDPTGPRIVVFAHEKETDDSDGQLLLPAHFRQSLTTAAPLSLTTEAQVFWRLHFQWTVRVNFWCGDVSEDFDLDLGSALVKEWMENGKFSDPRYAEGGEDSAVGDVVKELCERLR